MTIKDKPQDILRTHQLVRDPLGRKVLEARLRRLMPSGFRKGSIDWTFGRVTLSTRV